MKKLALVLLILSLASGLYATVYRSNQLHQKLEELPGVPETGYALEVRGTESKLYLDGKAVLTINESIQGNDRIIEQFDLLSGNTTTRIYKNGLLTRETETGEDGVSETVYVYVEGHLAFCTVLLNGNTVETVFFLRSSGNDEPVAVRDNNGLRFMSNSYLFQSGELFEILSSNLILSGDYETLESGDILVRLEDGNYRYSPDGLLLEVVRGSAVTTNEYDGLDLIRSETVDGAFKTVTFYEDGREKDILEYEADILVSFTTFSDTGKVQTLYRNGRELATVYYKEDNRTVDRIEYR